MESVSRFVLLVATLVILVSTSGCFHHTKHRHKPTLSETGWTPKIRTTPTELEPARQVSVPAKEYTYEYYPSVDVYYDTTRKLYFYTDGEDWLESENLPETIIINKSEAETVRLKSDKPFLSERSRGFWSIFSH